MDKGQSNTWLAVVAIVAVFFLFNSQIRSDGKVDTDARIELGNNPPESETVVLVSQQSAEGVTNDQISAEVAEALGEWSLERLKVHEKRSTTEPAAKQAIDRFRQGTVIFPSDDMNLIITRFYLDNANPALQVIGIQGDELTRIMCQSDDGSDVLLRGKCAREVERQFGVELR